MNDVSGHIILWPPSSSARSLRSGWVVGRFAPPPQSGAASLVRVSSPLPPSPRSGRGVFTFVSCGGGGGQYLVRCDRLPQGSRRLFALVADRWRSRAAVGWRIDRPPTVLRLRTGTPTTRSRSALRLWPTGSFGCGTGCKSRLQPTAATRASTRGNCSPHSPWCRSSAQTPFRAVARCNPTRQHSPRADFTAFAHG